MKTKANPLKVVSLSQKSRDSLLRRLDDIRAQVESGFVTGLGIACSTREGGVITSYEGDNVFVLLASCDTLMHRIRMEKIELAR